MDDERRFSKSKKKRKRTVIAPHEMDILESSFRQEPRPDRSAKLRLAKQLGKTDTFISIWFQNRRARERKMLHSEVITSPTRFEKGSIFQTQTAGVQGSSTMTSEQEEPLDLSDSSSTRARHDSNETMQLSRRPLFGRIIRMAAAAEGGILAPDSPFLTEAMTDACQGILLSDGRLVYTRDIGFDIQDT